MKKVTNIMVCMCLALLVVGSVNTVIAAEKVTLRMLVWEGYTPDELTKKFTALVKEKHDVDLTLKIKFCGGNDDFFPALRDDTADVISPSHNVPKDKRFKLIQMNLVMPLDLENIPNYKNVLPSLKKADYCTEDKKVYAVPHVRGPYGLAYNTNIIKEEPKSWNILWDPQYKGKYVLGGINQYEHNVSAVALSLGLPADKIYDFKAMNKPEAQEKLEELAVNANGMWKGVDDAKTLKGMALATVWGFSLPELKGQGEVWKIAEPKEGTTGWVDNFMISNKLEKKPLHKKIAEEWLNFVLSDAYQIYDVRGLACAPITTTVKAKLTAAEVAQFHLDDPTHFQKNRILWKVLSKKNRKGLKMLWTDALNTRETQLANKSTTSSK